MACGRDDLLRMPPAPSIGMSPGAARMILHGVPAARDFAHDIGMALRFARCRRKVARAVRLEDLEHARRDLRIGPSSKVSAISRADRALRKAREVRAQQGAARPQSHAAAEEMVRDDRAQRPWHVSAATSALTPATQCRQSIPRSPASAPTAGGLGMGERDAHRSAALVFRGIPTTAFATRSSRAAGNLRARARARAPRHAPLARAKIARRSSMARRMTVAARGEPQPRFALEVPLGRDHGFHCPRPPASSISRSTSAWRDRAR